MIVPKNDHRVLYSIDQIRLLKSDEHHLSANEHFLLQLLQDTVSEIQELRARVITLENDKTKFDISL